MIDDGRSIVTAGKGTWLHTQGWKASRENPHVPSEHFQTEDAPSVLQCSTLCSNFTTCLAAFAHILETLHPYGAISAEKHGSSPLIFIN